MTSNERIQEIIDFATTDAYDDEEVMSGWSVALSDAVDLPFQARALGTEVTVHEFDSDTKHGLRCSIQREGKAPRWVGIDALEIESVPESVREVFDAHEAWAGGAY